MNRWWIAFFTILIAGSGWLYWTQVPLDAQAESLAPEPALGRLAPDFTLQTLDDKSFTLAELQGKPVVLNFWATWCGPCQRELPALQATAARYDGEVVFAGIDQAEPPDTVRPYVEQMGLTFDIPLDRSGEIANRYNVRGLPTTYFIDADGIIRHIWMGEMNSVTLAEGISKIWP